MIALYTLPGSRTRRELRRAGSDERDFGVVRFDSAGEEVAYVPSRPAAVLPA